jgi:hypothetical protein
MGHRDRENRRRGYEQEWRNREDTRSGEGGAERGYGAGREDEHYRTRDEARFGRPPSKDTRDYGDPRRYDEGRFRQQLDTWPSQRERDLAGGLDETREQYYRRYGDEGRFYGRDDEGVTGGGMDEGEFWGRGTDMGRRYRPEMEDQGYQTEWDRHYGPMRSRGMDEGRNGGRGVPEASQGRGMQGMGMRFDPVRGYGRMSDRSFGDGGPGMMGMDGGMGERGMGQTVGTEDTMRRRMGRGPKGYRRTDERIREEVCERLMRHPWADSSEVDVFVKDGEVTLAGTVPDRRTKREIEDVAEDVLGVRDMQNLLRVRREEPMLGRGEESRGMTQQGEQRTDRGSDEDGARRTQQQGFQQQQPTMKASSETDNKGKRM